MKRGEAHDLRRTQDLFWSLITAPEGVGPALAELRRSGRIADGELERIWVGEETGGELTAAARLDIYANMYFYRLLDCLKEDYPRVHEALGADRFHNLITDYLLKHPSDNPSLRFLGRHLPGFVAASPIGGEFPYLADLARLEWARVEVFDAPDLQPLSRAALERLPQERAGEARFGLIPAFDLLRFDFDVARLWRDLKDGSSAQPKVEAGAAPGRHRTLRRRSNVRVWRKEFIVYHKTIDEEEALSLDELRAGAPLDRICQQIVAGRSASKATERVGRMLQSWLEDGLLSELTLPD